MSELYSFLLKKKNIETVVFHLLVHSPDSDNSLQLARPKPRATASSYSLDGGSPKFWDHLLLRSQATAGRLDVEWLGHKPMSRKR